MNGYDGPTLRSVRESSNVPLRRVARQAGMSHGHLSKVERGEPGRPVTPAVLHAYELATGVRLTGLAGHGSGEGEWRRGRLSETRRRTLNAKVAAVAVGGPLGEQLGRMLDATGRPVCPPLLGAGDVVQVEQVAALCTGVDLRWGGGVADQMARALLRWAVGLLESDAPGPVASGIFAAVAAVGQRAGWAAFDADSHDVARTLFTVALFAATQADDADLRAHILADVAAQYNFLGYPADCLQVVRFGETDERVGPAVKMVINAVKARAYGLLGEGEACRRHVGLADEFQVRAIDAGVGDGGGWLASVVRPARLMAGTGHALATLARRAGDAGAGVEASGRLVEAVDRFDPVADARALGLCVAQLSMVYLDAGDVGSAVKRAGQAVELAGRVRSSRLDDHLAALRAAAVAVPDGQGAELVELVVSGSAGDPVAPLAGGTVASVGGGER